MKGKDMILGPGSVCPSGLAFSERAQEGVWRKAADMGVAVLGLGHMHPEGVKRQASYRGACRELHSPHSA